DDEIRDRIVGITGGVDEVEQTTAGAYAAREERSRGVVVGDRRLRILGGETEPCFVVEVLGDAEAVLASPAESDVILCVNGHRRRFGAVVETLLRLRDQTPHLASGERPAVGETYLTPDLALPHYVAVALAVVRSDAGAQPIEFVIAGQFQAVGFAFEEEGQ